MTAEQEPIATSILSKTRRIFLSGRSAIIALNAVIYFLLIRWAFKNIDFSALLIYLERIPAWAIVGSLVVSLAILIVYGVRMAVLLERGFGVSFGVVNIGYALNTVLPFRLGDAMKIFLCHRLFQIRISALLGATLAEKLIDLTAIILLGGGLVVFSASRFVNAGMLVPLIVVVAGIAVGVAIFRIYLARFVHMLPKNGGLRRGVIALHRQLRNYRAGPFILATSAVWALNIALTWFTFNTYLPGVHVDLLDAIALLVITALVIAIPSAPAGIGLFEAGIVAYLHQKVGIGNEAALAAATVYHVVIIVPQTGLAGLWLWFTRRQASAA